MSRKSNDFKRSKSLPELIADTRKPKRLADTAWYKVGEVEDYEIPFEDDWVNVSGDEDPDARWYMNEEGETIVEGIVTGGAEGSTIFTFPEENRPRYRKFFTCAVVGGGSANVCVYPNGEVVLESFN